MRRLLLNLCHFLPLILLFSLGSACDLPTMTDGGGVSTGEPDDAGQVAEGEDGGTTDPPSDLTDQLFESDRLIQVDISIDAPAWDNLRTEGRSILNIIQPGCTDQPYPSPFNWYDADVVIDGEAIDEIAVRKKGFLGSLSEEKPSLKLDFDRRVPEQQYQDSSRMTLNNVQQDPSYVRTCLAYNLFTAAGIPAPRCNFASVSVNGEALGPYVHVEAIKRPFIRRHFDDDSGLLFEGTLTDFREGWLGTLEQKVDEDMLDFSVAEGIAAALEQDDDGLLAALEPYLDLDTFLTFWSMEVITSHWDGYAGNTNNFYLYVDPATGQANFIPWGVDATFQPGYLIFEDEFAPPSVFASGLLARRLYEHPEVQPQYLARLTELLDSVFNEDNLQDEVDRMAAIIEPALLASQNDAHQQSLLDVRGFIEYIRGAITTEIEDGPVTWDFPLRETPCLPDIGDVSGTFETTFGTFPVDDYLATGTGSLGGVISGDALTLFEFGSGIGNDEDRITLIIVGIEGAEQAVFMVVTLDADQFIPGGVAIDDVKVNAGVYRYDAGDIQPLGYVYEGEVVFSEVSDVAGAPVSGSVQGSLVLF